MPMTAVRRVTPEFIYSVAKDDAPGDCEATKEAATGRSMTLVLIEHVQDQITVLLL